MKMKRTLAFIAALSMLSATGVTAFAEEAAVTEIESSAVEMTTEESTEATEVTDVTEETVTTETSETAAVEGDVEEDVIANAIDADFTIGDESFYTEVSGSDLIIYKITDKDSATQVGKFSLDGLANKIDHYEVYGNQLVVVCYVDDKIATVNYYYDSTTGEFRYGTKSDNLEYNARKQKFELNGVSFIAELESDVSPTNPNMSALYLSIYFEDGTATNLQNILVVPTYAAGNTQGEAVTTNVNNYFTISGDNLNVYSEYTDTSASYVFDKAANKFVESGSTPDEPEVTEQMLHDKFVSECGSEFIFVDETFMDINGVPSAMIKVEDPNKITVDTYLVTMDNVKLINSVVKGGMGSTVTYKSFTCDGQEFLAELVKTMSDATFISYITIYKCESNGSLNATNIKGEQIHLAEYRDIGNGTFDWVGDRNITVDQCISNDSNSITLNYENNRENTSKTVTYEYDKATNSFVEPGSIPDTPENPDKAIDIHEKDTLTITGTLKFVETGNGVNTVKTQVIVLDKPINVVYHVNGTDYNVSDGQTETVTEIQFSTPQDVNYKEGQRLSVTGKVMYGHTAYHATNIVLIDTTDVTLLDNTDTPDSNNNSSSNGSTGGTTANSPATSDTMSIPVALGSAVVVLSAVIYVSKKRK